jgi:hypothetical protein
MPVIDMIEVVRVPGDPMLSVDPASSLWRRSQPVFFAADNYGRRVEGMQTTVHSAWADTHLYLLFVCEYRHLNLNPHPQTTCATPELWNWDVAELFIGSTTGATERYREFEISPQGEWLDLDIDLATPDHFGDPQWSSGIEASAAIHHEQRLWQGALRIPFASISEEPISVGSVFRANLFRSQGPEHQLLAWQPSMSETFHVPECFGRLILAE